MIYPLAPNRFSRASSADVRTFRPHRRGESIRGLGVGLCLVLSACARPLPVSLEANRLLTRDETIEAVHEREAKLRSMRIRFQASVRSPSEDRRASGVVLVRKPDQLRLRLLSPFGLTVMDYIANDSSTRLQLPLEGKVLYDSEIEQETRFSPRAFGPAFLLEHVLTPEACEESTDGPFLDCRDDRQRRLRVDRHRGVVVSEVQMSGDSPTLTLTYSDFRSVGAWLLPFHVEAGDAGLSRTLVIDVVAYEINPELAESLFQPAKGSR